MIKQTPWIERKFNFDFDIGIFPCLLERLRYSPMRVEDLVKDLPEETMNYKPGGKWSIKEHIGHLASVEQLWHTRLEQFLAGQDTLITAEMTNKRTTDADFNSWETEDLISKFKEVRADFVAKLEKLDDNTIGKTAQHPRLNKPMRLADLAFFAAEHDDNEIALMRMKSRL